MITHNQNEVIKSCISKLESSQLISSEFVLTLERYFGEDYPVKLPRHNEFTKTLSRTSFGNMLVKLREVEKDYTNFIYDLDIGELSKVNNYLANELMDHFECDLYYDKIIDFKNMKTEDGIPLTDLSLADFLVCIKAVTFLNECGGSFDMLMPMSGKFLALVNAFKGNFFLKNDNPYLFFTNVTIGDIVAIIEDRKIITNLQNLKSVMNKSIVKLQYNKKLYTYDRFSKTVTYTITSNELLSDRFSIETLKVFNMIFSAK